MPESTGAHHLDDSDLLHLVDRSASAWELDSWSKHVLHCEECTARLETLRRRTDRFSALLSELELPADFSYPPAPKTRVAPEFARRYPAVPQRWLQAAAVVLLLVAPLLAQPVRAWVVEWAGTGWSELTALLGGKRASEAPAPVATEVASGTGEQGGSIVSDAPSGKVYRIEIESAQRAGVLVLQVVEGSHASLEVTLGSGRETALVLPGRGFRIQNNAGSTASYTLQVPKHLARVDVRIGSRSPRSLSAAQIGTEMRLDLNSLP